MKKLYTLLYLLLIITTFAQKDSILIKGNITEFKTNQPIPFASIFIHKTTTGVISDEKGNFQLKISKANLNDTLIVSSVGYSRFSDKISNFKNIKNINIALNDSIYLLDEVVALAYDYFETLEWKSKKSNAKAYYLTFTTKNIDNISNFIKILKSEFGKPKAKTAFRKWKRVKLPIHKEKVKIFLRFFECPYCTEKTDYTVTILLKDTKGKYLLNDTTKQSKYESYFQGLLDKTFDMGLDYAQLMKKNNIYYIKNDTSPYTAKCLGFFKNGQIGLKGQYKNGKKDGEWLYWYSNGQKKMIINYKEGIKEGQWTYWYESGQIRIKTHYYNNKLDGINYWWYSNGKLKKVSKYRKGIFVGKIEWDKNGKITDKYGDKFQF